MESQKPAIEQRMDIGSQEKAIADMIRRCWDGRLRTNIGNVSTLDDAVAAFNPTERISGKTIIRVRP
jgi:NADPH:quinone reductase-like Zn-dependent oxidoreductase